MIEVATSKELRRTDVQSFRVNMVYLVRSKGPCPLGGGVTMCCTVNADV